MAIIKCKMCGGDLEIAAGTTVGVCEFCDTKQTLPKSGDEVIENLFNRANALRLKCEFDKAEQIYEKILQENDEEAEAHWGIILCKYGIEYVEDPKTYKRIPTCHRTSYEAVTADEEYKAAIRYADEAQRQLYEAEAKTIDEIQKNILAIVKDEKPFDVFICYKETDEDGKRTVDSAIANDIYHQLTQEGLKVFYAAITLEDKLGREYEPYIFAALNSAKVMLVIGTKPRYFSAVWVKNEWSRFLKLMKTDRSKLLIPCYKDMDAYELPEEFAHLQAQDMSKIGFINDVVRGIKKVTVKDEPKPAVVKETVVTGGNTNTAPLLERAFMFLEDGDWARADEFCEQALNIEPKNAQAYLGKLMAELKVRKQEDLKNQTEPFNTNNNYQKALRFADDSLKTELTGYIEHINTRNKNQRLATTYNHAKNLMSNAQEEGTFVKAAELFESIKNYKDAVPLAKQCREQAEQRRKQKEIDQKNRTYDLGRSRFDSNSVQIVKDAQKLFESISGWKDADAQAEACKKKIKELEEKAEAERLEQERQKQLALEAEQLALQAAKRRKKIITLTMVAAIVVVIAFVVVLITVIIPGRKYNNAVALMEAGKYDEAIANFTNLTGYKDSGAKKQECEERKKQAAYDAALELMNAGKYKEAKRAFEAMYGYADSKDKVAECQNKILDQDYEAAIEMLNAGQYEEAAYAFKVLGGHKDSVQKREEALLYMKKEELKGLAVGDRFELGNYYGDIAWYVLDVQDGKILVISQYALECAPYDYNTSDLSWENCSLRQWLNNDFMNLAFTESEKSLISTVTLPAETKNGNATEDRVFPLSLAEAEQYFPSEADRICTASSHAVSEGIDRDYGSANCMWWLRTLGTDSGAAVVVDRDGKIWKNGFGAWDEDNGVRPAMWIDLNG